MSTDMQIKHNVVTNEDVQEPGMFRVIYCNDDVTTVEFVIATLMSLFSYNEGPAMEKAGEIHNHGEATVAEYPYEFAEQKATEVVLLARKNGFPLDLRIEAVE